LGTVFIRIETRLSAVLILKNLDLPAKLLKKEKLPEGDFDDFSLDSGLG